MADQMEYNFELFTFGKSSDDTSNPDTLETKNQVSVRLGKIPSSSSSSSEKLDVANSLASRLGKIPSSSSSSEKLAIANSLVSRLGTRAAIHDRLGVKVISGDSDVSRFKAVEVRARLGHRPIEGTVKSASVTLNEDSSKQLQTLDFKVNSRKRAFAPVDGPIEFKVEQLENRAKKFTDYEAMKKRSKKFDEEVAPSLQMIREAKIKNRRYDRFAHDNEDSESD